MNQSDVVAIVYAELLKVAGGAAVIIAALLAFLGKVWIDRIASREAERRDAKLAELRAQFEQRGNELKAQLDIAVQRTVHVDKLQFEHEYEIYRNAWERLFALRQATMSLRPMMDQVHLNETKEERMRQRIGEFRVQHNLFLEIVEMNKPFYPEKVYTALANVREKCREEVINYEYTERSHKEYWSEARNNQDEILALINAACEAIRTRVSEVRVA